jgi:hypothetical protein
MGQYLSQGEKWVVTGPEASAVRTLGDPTRSDHYTNGFYARGILDVTELQIIL